MRIEFFDVEHGQCILITADNGQYMLIDCGHNDTTGWRPSNMLASRRINQLEVLAVTNLDEDHITDVANVAQHFGMPGRIFISIQNLASNYSLTPDVIRAMKAPNELSQNMQTMCALLEQFVPNAGGGINNGAVGDLTEVVPHSWTAWRPA